MPRLLLCVLYDALVWVCCVVVAVLCVCGWRLLCVLCLLLFVVYDVLLCLEYGVVACCRLFVLCVDGWCYILFGCACVTVCFVL